MNDNIPTLDPNNEPSGSGLPQLLPDPPISPLAPSIAVNTVPSDIGAVNFPEYLTEWIPFVNQSSNFINQTNTNNQTTSEYAIEKVPLAIILMQKGQLNTEQYPGFVSDVGTTYSATSSSAALTQVIMGLGNSHLQSTLSAELLTQSLNNILNVDPNNFITKRLATTIIGLLTQIVTREAVIGALPGVARLFTSNANVEDPNAAIETSAGLSSSSQILKLVTSGDLSQTISDALSKIDLIKGLNPNSLGVVQQSAALSVALLSLALLGQSTNTQNAVQQQGFFALVSGISPNLLPATPVDLYTQSFDVQSSIQQGVQQVQNSPPQTTLAVQNSISDSFAQQLALAGVPQNNAQNLAPLLVTNAFTAASNKTNTQSAIQNTLSSQTNLTGDQATLLASELQTSLLIDLLIAQFGNNAATVFGQPTNTQLTAASAEVQRATYSGAPFSDEVKTQINKNLAVVQDISNSLSQTNNQKLIETATDSFRSFEASVIQPSVFLQELIDPSKTFIGIMYSGIKEGYMRGSIDIAV